MNIFVIGFPESGRTTFCKSISDKLGIGYIECGFSIQFESPDRLKEAISYPEFKNNMLDGVASPADFTYCFNYEEDMVIFLNRIDNKYETKDWEAINISVIRDYCYWLSSAGKLNKDRWLEFNFRFGDNDYSRIKCLGSKNCVYVVKSIEKVLEIAGESIARFI